MILGLSMPCSRAYSNDTPHTNGPFPSTTLSTVTGPLRQRRQCHLFLRTTYRSRLIHSMFRCRNVRIQLEKCPVEKTVMQTERGRAAATPLYIRSYGPDAGSSSSKRSVADIFPLKASLNPAPRRELNSSVMCVVLPSTAQLEF